MNVYIQRCACVCLHKSVSGECTNNSSYIVCSLVYILGILHIMIFINKTCVPLSDSLSISNAL